MRDENLRQSRLGAYNELIAAAWLMKRGYEVFRNVAPVGPVDLVGIKEGKTEFFDVKGAYRTADGQNIYSKLSERQQEMGVKCICVFDSGECEVDTPATGGGRCEECNGEFLQGKRWDRKRFCSQKCGQVAYKRRKRGNIPAETPIV